MLNYVTMYNLSVSIGTTEANGSWTYAELKSGIDNVGESLNEVIQQYQFLSGGGFAENHVTGMAPAWTLSGKRVLGDAAQDYIFAQKYKLDKNRASSLQIKYKDAEDKEITITVPCTICNIQEWSGTSTDDSRISFELRFDGKPTLE